MYAKYYSTSLFRSLASDQSRKNIWAIVSAIIFLLVFLFFAIQSADALTGIRRTINFQGKLTNTNGTNVTDGDYSIVFAIYDVSSGGTALWTETQGTVAVADGIFIVELGSSTAFPANFNFNWDGRYLGINVAGDGEMTPRIRLTAVPYAFNAEKVAGLTVQDTSGNASTSGTLQIPNAETINLGNNSLTFSTGADTTLTLPSTGTLATLAGTEEFTNKTIGSTGLIFSGATTDITTVSNEDLTLAVNGSGNIVFSGDFDSGITLGTAISTEFPLLVRSGIGNNAALAVDNLNSGDLFTASASGTTKFILANDGTLTLNNYITDANAVLYTTTAGVVTRVVEIETPSLCLLSGNGTSGVPSWGSCPGGGGGSSNWTLGAGFLTPNNSTVDLLIGGQATTSAKFAILNINSASGSQIATLSGDLVLNKAGSIQTTNKQTLTLGGSNTGNVVIDSGSSRVNLPDYTDCTLKTDSSGNVTCGGITASTSDAIGAKAISTTTQTISSSTNTAVTLNSEEFDSGSFHDNATNNTRVTIPAGMGGKYLITGYASFLPGATGQRVLYVRKNGDINTSGSEVNEPGPTAANNSEFNVTNIMDLQAGDYIELIAYQNSGGDIDIGSASLARQQSFLSVVRLDSGGNIGGEGIGAKAVATSVQSVPNATYTALTLNREDFDTDGFHSTSSNTERMVIPAGLGGTYLILGSTEFAGNGTGQRILDIRVNGQTASGLTSRDNPSSGTNIYINTSAIHQLNPGDYVDLVAYQNSGGNLNVGNNTNDDTRSTLNIIRLDAGGGGGPAIGARGHQNSAQSVPTGTWTALQWNDENFDTDGFHDNATNNTRFTIPAGLGGTYLLTGASAWTANSSASRYIAFAKNGTRIMQHQIDAVNLAGEGQFATDIIQLQPGDYVELQVYHEVGSNLNTLVAGDQSGYMALVLLDSQDGDDAQWDIANGVITPKLSSTLDFLLGNSATSSAEFGVIGINDGTPIATISATLGGGAGNGLYLAGGTATIQSTRMNTLTLGGSTTGNVVIDSGSGVITLSDNLTLSGTTITASSLTTLTTAAGFTIDSPSYVKIGDGATTPTTASGDDDLFVLGDLEVGATATVSGNLTLAGAARSLSTTAMNTLTLGGSDTGNVVIDSGSSRVNLPDYTDCTLKTDSSGNVTCGGITASTSDAIGAKAYNNAAQSVPLGESALTLNSEDFDTEGFHNTSSNTERMTIPAGLGGKYLIIGKTYATFGSLRYLSLYKNNEVDAFTRTDFGSNDLPANLEVSAVVDLQAGDYIYMKAYNANASSQNFGGSTRRAGTELQIIRLDSGGNIGGSAIGARLYHDSNQSIPNNTNTPLNFNQESFDTDGFHDTSTNNTRFTIPAGLGGTYVIGGSMDIEAAASGQKQAMIRLNGSTIIATTNEVSNSSYRFRPHISTSYSLRAGDYVELIAYHDSGSSKNSYATTDYFPHFYIYRLDSGGAGGPAIGAKVYHNTTQTLSNVTNTPVNFNSEEFDTDGFHDNATNNTRFTIPAGLGGTYLLTGYAQFNPNGTGARLVEFRKNGTGEHPPQVSAGGSSSANQGLQTSTIVELEPGDYMEVIVYQSSGGNLNIGNSSSRHVQSEFTITLLDSQDGDDAQWDIANGVITPKLSSTLDFLLGNSATSSAEFGVIGINDGTPTASISATLGGGAGNGLSLAGSSATIQSLRMGTLTLGGSSTGNIVIDSGSNLTQLSDATINLSSFGGGSANAVLYANSSNNLAQATTGSTGLCLVSGESIPSWDDCAAGTGSNWSISSNAFHPKGPYTAVSDFLLGSSATSSAEFAVIGINDGTPTASISATLGGGAGNGLSLAGSTATIQSLRMGTLTLGGSSTGNIVIDSGSSLITLSDNTTITGTLTGLTGLTLSSGAINLGGSNGTTGDCIKGGTTAAWGSCGGGGGSNWTLGAGFLTPNNSTVDLLIGGQATTSAKFAVLNVNGATTPVASLSATTDSGGTGNGIVLDANGTIQSLRFNTLTLGGNTTGNIVIDSGSSSISLSDNTSVTGTLGVSSLISANGGLTVANGQTLTALGIVTLGDGSDTFAVDSAEFDVDSTTGAITINDDGNLGNINIEGTTLDINSLDFIGAGLLTSASNTDLTLTPQGSGNLIISGDFDSGVTIGSAVSTEFPLLIRSGIGNNATLAIDQLNLGDIFTASAGGTMRFSITSAGGLRLGLTEDEGTLGECLKSGGTAATVSWDACGGGGSNWTLNTTTGVLRPNNNTTDLILGGTATASAKFLFTNMISGNPTLRIYDSASTNYLALYHDGTDGHIEASSGDLIIGNGVGSGVVIEDAIINDTTTNAGAVKVGDKFLVQKTENSVVLGTFDNTGSGDILTASASGTTRFTIQSDGGVAVSPATFSTDGEHGVSIVSANSGSSAITNAGLRVETTSNNTNSSSNLYGIEIEDLSSGGENANEIALRIGIGWDKGIVIESGGSTNQGLVYSGSGRPTKKIALNAEYPGAVPTASGSGATTGTMTSEASSSAALSNYRSYYEWNSPETSLQNYTIMVRVKLPEDFSAWATSNAITISYNTELTTSDTSKMDVFVYNADSTLSAADSATPVAYYQANVSATVKTWLNLSIDDSDLDAEANNDLDAPGDEAIIFLKLYSKDNNHVQVGDIVLSYLAKF